MRGKVAVIGGGIIGLAIARSVARAGGRVVVFEGQEPGMRASWAAAGMLAPQSEADQPGPFLSLLLEARELFPELSRQLREETGMDIGYRDDGMLVVATDDAEEVELSRRFAWQSAAGLSVELLTGGEVRALEPALSGEIRSGLRFPRDHQVDNRLLTRALFISAVAAGSEIRIGQSVRSIRYSGAGISLKLHDGSTEESEYVVLAAGSWSGMIDGLPRTLPVRPIHGQLFAIEMAPPVLRHTIAAGGAYMVPRDDGRLIIGATSQDVGFREGVTPSGLGQLATAAIRLSPGIGERPIVSQWSGLRPGTPDGLPILGSDPDVRRLIYATGHYRNGILLAPITATIIRSLLFGETPAVDLTPYRPDRF